MLFYILLFCDVQGQSDSTNITDFTKLLQGAFSESDNKDWQSANHQWQKITSNQSNRRRILVKVWRELLFRYFQESY